ncbi:MAG: accessory gene regulator B family protein, partial [Syntrophomonadaceae bacterium]|nr:accessory gene regulator B family protein [Syntrophomonadaceae bacterium]
MHYWAVKIAEFLVKDSDYQSNRDEIRYVLEIFLGAALQILIIICMAAILGLGKEVATILLVSAVLRKYSGGAHCQAFYRCTLCSIAVFLALGLLVQFNNPDYFQYFFPFVILFSLITVFRKAPVDNPENPIVDSNEQRRLKRMSVMILLVFLLLAAIASFYYSWMAASILLGIVWQVFT